MIKIDKVIVVEGKYDKIKLSKIVDATIITTDGFNIFKNKQKQKLIRKLADEKGILILTDSDSAGFVIRSFLKGIVDNSKISHAYIPDLYGKERRKNAPSAEGKLGVEGVSADTLRKCLENEGIEYKNTDKSQTITKTDLYTDGLFGKNNSKKKRAMLQKKLELPENMTANLLLDMLNILLNKQEYEKIIKEIDEQCE